MHLLTRRKAKDFARARNLAEGLLKQLAGGRVREGDLDYKPLFFDIE